MSSPISHLCRFGDFAVDTDQRVLLRKDKPVPLTPKVFDTLLLLVQHHGRIVEKDELMHRLWPDSFVEEANLTFNVQQLRRTLGDDARKPVYIETVARRGYRFIAKVDEISSETSPMPGHVSVRPSGVAPEAANAGATARENQSREGVVPQSDTPPPLTETVIAPPSGSARPSLTTRRPLLIASAVAVTFLLGTALVAWHFGNGSRRNRNDSRTVESLPSIALPALKIEKLTGSGTHRHVVISPDGKYVAYSSDAKGRQSIWLRQLATNTAREIVSLTEGVIGGLAFAHSGDHLYFVKGRPGPTALYRIPLPLGGLPTKVIDKPQGTFSLSPDDSQVAFVRYSDDDKECALMIATTHGSHERTLAVHARPNTFNTPAWSPDGQAIAVAAGPSDSGGQEVRIVEINVADGSTKDMSADRWFYVRRIVWLPDRSGLIMVGRRKVGETNRLWRISYPHGKASPITDGHIGYADISITADARQAVAPQEIKIRDIWVGSSHEPGILRRITQAENFCWMPDGRIIYSSHASASVNLWVMQPDGTDQKQLTDSGENGYPVVTPNGRHIVFTSNRTGTLHLWRMDADGSNQTQLTHGNGVNHPSLSPNGRWIVYNTVADWHLWRISIDGGEPVRLADFYSISPSVSPDGKLIACIGRAEGDREIRKPFIIPFDGGRPLKEFDIAPMRLSSYRLRWTPDGDALLYAASRDRIASLFRHSSDGRPAEIVVDFNEDDIFDFGYSPGGQQLAVTRGGWRFDVVLMRDFNQ